MHCCMHVARHASFVFFGKAHQKNQMHKYLSTTNISCVSFCGLPRQKYIKANILQAKSYTQKLQITEYLFKLYV